MRFAGSYTQVYFIEADDEAEAADILGDIRGTIPGDHEFTEVEALDRP